MSSIREDAEEWEPGKHLRVKVRSCEIVPTEKKTSLDDAIKEGLHEI